MTAHLADWNDAVEGVLAGTETGVAKVRRLCDLAADSFIRRLEAPPVPLRPSERYTPAEIDQVRDLSAAALGLR